MRSILVVARTHLFPGLSPQGFLPAGAVDLDALGPHLFFAERIYMEQCSHYKQIIPYLVLERGRGADRRVLCYQRKAKHTEQRLGGLWSVGFGGHIEPLDRHAPEVEEHGLMKASALRELVEETGLTVAGDALRAAGFINSDSQDVSSVHFGAVFRIALDAVAGTDEELLATVMAQAEPHTARWVPASHLPGMTCEGDGPAGGSFEDWSRIVIQGMGFGATAEA